MKKIFSMSVFIFCIGAFSSCKKDSSSTTTPTTAKCKPLTETSNLVGNNVAYTYSYNTDGTLANISYSPYNMAIGYSSTSITNPSSTVPGLTDSFNTSYNANIYTGLPTTASQSITTGGFTQVNYWEYHFSYDAKSRLIQVIEITPNITTDDEYKLTISYNDQDNVTQLKYEAYTGTAYVSNINAIGYDDKPSPYSAIKNWPFLMHAGWSNYDPAPLFEALSKNNPLGFNLDISTTRTMTYTYNENGFPIRRTNTNTNSSGSYSFDETYTYQCE